MKQLLFAMFLFQLVFVSCQWGGEKSKNELRYDSLVAVIEPGMTDFQEIILAQPDSEQRDSTLLMSHDITDLTFPEFKEKYQLKDTAQERQFLDALSVTAQIITATQKLKELLGR